MFGIVVSLLLLAIAVYLIKHLAEYGCNRGPVLYPYVGSLPEMIRNKDRILEWATDSLKQDRTNTMRLMRPGSSIEIQTASPANVEHFLKTNFHAYEKGDSLRRVLADLLGGGIFNVDGGLWKLQRRIASFELSTRSLREYLMDILQDETRSRLLPTVESFVGSNKLLDLQDLFMRFTFDSICKLAFGVDPHALSHSLKFMEAFDDAVLLTNLRFYHIHPNIWKFKRLLRIGSERKLRQAIQVVHEFADSVVEKRKTGGGRKLDLLSRFMTLDNVPDIELDEIHAFYGDSSGSAQCLSDVFLRDIIVSFLIAGRDTSGASLAWFFWLLSKNTDAQKTIVNEVQAVTGGKHQGFSFQELKDMHYLHAAISETLRLYPPVPMDTRVAAEDDVWPDGTRVKKGMEVTYHAFAMGRMEQLWGEDCLEFKPERWLKDGHFVPESPFKFTAFHAGPRICLGREMAMAQMKYVAAALISSFCFRIMPADYTPSCKISLTLQISGGLHVAVHSRQEHGNFEQ